MAKKFGEKDSAKEFELLDNKDFPSSYSGKSDNFLRVKLAEDGVELADLSSLVGEVVATGTTTVAHNTQAILDTFTIASDEVDKAYVTPKTSIVLAVAQENTGAGPANGSCHFDINKTVNAFEHEIRVRHKLVPASSVDFNWVILKVKT